MPVLRLLSAFLILLSLSACGGYRNPRQSVLFHVVNTAPFSSLDPAVEQGNGILILHNVYETLTVYDDTDGQVKPCLAESWTSNATKTEWTFFLRRDVLFHDGSLMTAASVKKSIDRVRFLGKGASSIWDCIASIEARDINIVVFRLNYAADLPLIASSSSAAYIISSAAASRGEAWFNEGHDAGSGPYRISAASSTSVALDAYEGYRGGWLRGKYRRILIAEVPSPERRLGYLQNGKADIVFFPGQETRSGPAGMTGIGGIPAAGPDTADGLTGLADVHRVSRPDDTGSTAKDSYKLTLYKSWQSLVLFFNTEKDPCSSEDFRKALAYAFPYEETVGSILKGQASRSNGMVPQGIWGHDPSLPSFRCDLDTAREYLQRSGQQEVTLTLSYQPLSREQTRMLELYRQNLESLGINLILLESDWETMQMQAQNPDPDDRQDLLLLRWWPIYADPGIIFKTLLVDQGPDKGLNYSYLHAADLSLSLQIASILSLEKRPKAEEIYRNMQQKVFDRCYLVFLYDTAVSVACRKDIERVSINPAYASCISYYNLYNKENP